MKKNTLSNLNPVRKFIDTIGQDIKKYFGKNKSCIIYLLPDGIFYGRGLYNWLGDKKNINITTMDDDGKDLKEEKVQGRKVLIIDNDIITGKGYKRSMEAMRLKKERLKIKDIKFAVFSDRVGLADFAVEGYSADAPWNLKDLDALDLKIIQAFSQDGRRSFVEIAKKIGLSSVGVKKRVEKLLNQNVLKIQGLLYIEKFYSLSALIEIETDNKTISNLIEKFEKSPLVYLLVKASGRYNLLVGIVTPNLEGIESFISKEIRANPGVKHIEVSVGELPIIPKGLIIPIT